MNLVLWPRVRSMNSTRRSRRRVMIAPIASSGKRMIRTIRLASAFLDANSRLRTIVAKMATARSTSPTSPRTVQRARCRYSPWVHSTNGQRTAYVATAMIGSVNAKASTSTDRIDPEAGRDRHDQEHDRGRAVGDGEEHAECDSVASDHRSAFFEIVRCCA